MKKEYDFSKGKRGAVLPAKGKTQVTLRLDGEVLDWFRAEAHKAGGGNAAMINDALREYIHQRKEPLEDTLRRVLREELQNTA